ncbi:MAG: hypothetical protein ABSG75_11045 [Syntrophales bacterium]|jgi:hypothetical protein
MATGKKATERICEFGGVKKTVLDVPVEHGPPVVLGERGAKAVLENLDAIRAFVARQEITRHAVEQMAQGGIGETQFNGQDGTVNEDVS